MFAQVLRMQWRGSRQAVLTFVVLGFAAPLMTVMFQAGDQVQLRAWLMAAERIGMAMPVLALLLGVFLGLTSWAPDHAGKHVYALSLPVPRWKLVLLRFGAGGAMLLLPVAALGLGSLIATRVAVLPEGIHAFPLQLTARFALAALMCYAVFFSLSIATRHVVLLLLGLVGGVVLADVTLAALQQTPVVSSTVLLYLTAWPGPLAILGGRWALFDV